jgi:hypothetical protein
MSEFTTMQEENKAKLGLTRQRKARSWFLYAALLFFGLASIFVFFRNDIIGTVWHIQHGSTTLFQEHEIPVPKGWWAFHAEGGLVIQRMSASFDRKDTASILVGPLRWPADRPFNITKWKTAMITVISARNYEFKYSTTIDAGETITPCLHFDSIQGSDNVLANCFLPNAEIYAEFRGSPRYLPTLDTIVRGIRHR